MYVIRRAKADDTGTLLKMAKMVHFINLPADKSIITEKIRLSRQSFMRAAGSKKAERRQALDRDDGGIADKTAASDLFMFVLEDRDSPGCLGTSQLVSQMGGEGSPNVCFKLEQRQKYSKALKFGATHTVARVYLDESGPTELGGLILQPSFRGHPLKLGRFVSLVRFHWIGLHRRIFRPSILAELMAPISSEGENMLWEHLGRRFIPLSYTEADRFCQHSREFMTSLLPSGDIHLSLLPPEARALVGEVGAETRPARLMLERLGFGYDGLVDPFDGGPYLTARTDSIDIVRDTHASMFGKVVTHGKTDMAGIVSTLDSDGEFAAVQAAFTLDREGRVCVTRETMEAVALPRSTCEMKAGDSSERSASSCSVSFNALRRARSRLPIERFSDFAVSLASTTCSSAGCRSPVGLLYFIILT